MGRRSRAVRARSVSAPTRRWKPFNFKAVETPGSSYFIDSTPAGTPVQVLGGLSNDTFYVTAATLNNFTLSGALSVYGFGGFDQLTYSAGNYNGPPVTFNLTPAQINVNSNANILNYNAIGALTLLGPALFQGTSHCHFVVTGTSPQITTQTTILMGSTSTDAHVYPHDAQGNPTLATSLGIGNGTGGLANYTVYVEDAGSSSPIDYVFSNPFGAGTADIAGLGNGLLGIANDVQNIVINAGDADDTFTIASFKSGSGLSIRGGGGDDTLHFGATTFNQITNMASFDFDGQGGFRLVLRSRYEHRWMDLHAVWARWELSAYSGGSYFLTDENIERMQIDAAQGDAFRVTAVAAGTELILNGGDGFNTLVLGFGTNKLDTIRGPITYNPIVGSMFVSDSSSTTGKILHLDANSLGAYPGDTLFGPGGSLHFSGIWNNGASPGSS